MKLNKTTSLILFGLIIIIGIILAITNGSRQGVEITVQQDSPMDQENELSNDVAPGVYTVSPERSQITWEARKTLIENYIDKGTLSLASGTVTVNDEGTIESGSLEVAINSLVVTETGINGGFNGLANDILSGRFLDAEQYPTATFEVTRVIEAKKGMVDIEGALTIKGVTQNIIAPALVQSNGEGALQLMTEFDIDRTAFDITFGSGKFFDDLGDKVIDDMVHLQVFIEATLAA